MKKHWDELARILFILFVSFSLIIHNVLILPTINNNFIAMVISLVTIGLGILVVYFSLNYRLKLESKIRKNIAEVKKC